MAEQPSELKERSARLNTFLRFGRVRHALVEAYQLRTYIQLKGARLEAEVLELERVEKVISKLEKQRTSGIQKLIKSIFDLLRESLHPEVENTSTLLDQFAPARTGLGALDHESDETPPQAIEDSEPSEETFESYPPVPTKPQADHSGEEEVDWGWGPPAGGR